MGAVATLLDSRAAGATLRRGLAGARVSTLTCRAGRQLARTVENRLVDCVVLGPRALRGKEIGELRSRFPRIPLVVFGPIRTSDYGSLRDWYRGLGAETVLVEGVDDPIAGEMVLRSGLAARRRRLLAGAPGRLRLTEPLQRSTWDLLTATVAPPPSTAVLARRLGVSREHLSRQFGAGGAPNLKRVIDLLQVVVARELLANPGCSTLQAGRLLGYSSLARFRAVVRRVADSRPADLPGMAVPDLVRRFVRGRMRSRS